ncbi:MAG: hypothetical protein ACE5PV_27770, partial [Candidatus Poribacteria bacterium]
AGSGFIGRYLYAHISHNVEGNGMNVNEIEAQKAALFSELLSRNDSPTLECGERRMEAKPRLADGFSELGDDAAILISQIERVSSRIKQPPVRSSFIALGWMLWADCIVWRTRRKLMRSIAKLIRKDRAKRKRIRQLVGQRLFYERQSAIEMVAERLLRLWHILHKPLTILLFIGMLLHTVLALYLT